MNGTEVYICLCVFPCESIHLFVCLQTCRVLPAVTVPYNLLRGVPFTDWPLTPHMHAQAQTLPHQSAAVLV